YAGPFYEPIRLAYGVSPGVLMARRPRLRVLVLPDAHDPPGRSRLRNRLLRPDDLAGRQITGAPALGELRHQEQAPPSLVRHRGVAQMRRGAAAVEDLADQLPVAQHPHPDGAAAVPDRVGHQLTE